MKTLALQALIVIACCVAFLATTLDVSEAFSPACSSCTKTTRVPLHGALNDETDPSGAGDGGPTRRMILSQAALAATTSLWSVQPAAAAVGSLPEFSDTNAILQGITINVADPSQQNAMIDFLRDSFDFKILRQIKAGSNSDTWMGFGPEQLSIPSDFTLPVSSFAKYGGHASIHIRYDAQATNIFYRRGEDAPGNNLAFLQVGVPAYRISQMVKNGGNVLDAFGIVNVVSPCGLPMRGIVGISPDPIMFVALNCADVKQSRAFYEELGFVEQEYPYSRPSKGTGPFEPAQPEKSVYMAPTPNGMGVLLLQNKDRKKPIRPNPVLRSLNVVYMPSQGADASVEETNVVDLSGVPISFQSVGSFEAEQRASKL